MSRLYNEGPWWFLALPICLWRAVENAEADAAGALETTAADQARARPALPVAR